MPKTSFYALAAAMTLGLATPAAAAPSTVYDESAARAFCQSGDAAAAERCINQQELAAERIDLWMTHGEFPRYIARRAYQRCAARFNPDLRQAWICLDDLDDDLGRGSRIRRY